MSCCGSLLHNGLRSLLSAFSGRDECQEWALHRLTTIVEACRAMFKEALRQTLAWAVDRIKRFDQPYKHGVAQVGLS
jgi:hypothetical protein